MLEQTNGSVPTAEDVPAETRAISAPGWMDDAIIDPRIDYSPEHSDEGSETPRETADLSKSPSNETAPATSSNLTDPLATKSDNPNEPVKEEPEATEPPFILYKESEAFNKALDDLIIWVTHLLLPVYGREVSSQAPWCPRWWLHMEAVAQLYGLWMAWQELTGPKAPLTGPASWHRDYLIPVMTTLRDPSGPFAGCKSGSHRNKEAPQVDVRL